jgi:hypothetical protein
MPPSIPRLRIYPLGRSAGVPQRFDVFCEAFEEPLRRTRKSGRRVAAAEAAMPMPISTVLQIATSVVAQRKSSRLFMPLIYGRRIMVAEDALFP